MKKMMTMMKMMKMKIKKMKTKMMTKKEEKKEEKKKEEKEKKEDKYLTFWKEFGKNVKLGIIEDPGNRSKLAKLTRWYSSKD